MESLTCRACVLAIGWKVRLARLPVTWTARVQLAPSRLVSRGKAAGFSPLPSAPSPACLTTNEETCCGAPRSTWRNGLGSREHHLLLFISIPSKALAVDSLGAHGADPIAGLPRARLTPRLGALGGGVQPSLNDGG